MCSEDMLERVEKALETDDESLQCTNIDPYVEGITLCDKIETFDKCEEWPPLPSGKKMKVSHLQLDEDDVPTVVSEVHSVDSDYSDRDCKKMRIMIVEMRPKRR
jgi:hypothetical protein